MVAGGADAGMSAERGLVETSKLVLSDSQPRACGCPPQVPQRVVRCCAMLRVTLQLSVLIIAALVSTSASAADERFRLPNGLQVI